MFDLKALIKSSFVVGMLALPQICLANNWLIGLDVGRAYRSATFNITTVNADPAITAATGFPVGAQMASYSRHLSDQGTIFGLMGGYEWDWHPVWFASIEVHADWGSIEEERHFQYADNAGGSTLFNAIAKYRRGTQVDVSARLGVKGPRYWIPYVVAGGFTSMDKLTYIVDLVNGAFTRHDASYESDRVYGWLVGLGFELPLFSDSLLPMLKNSGVRAEYNYARAGRIKLHDVNFPLNGLYTARPQTHVFKLSLVLKHP